MWEDYMHKIYDIKNKIASELAAFRFWQLKLTAQPAGLPTLRNRFPYYLPEIT